jgi:hypothetical protein
MYTSVERPFTPVALTAATAESFALLSLAAQLTTDKAYTEHGRAGLTLNQSTGDSYIRHRRHVDTTRSHVPPSVPMSYGSI